MRWATRWGGENPHPGLLRLAAALQVSLRGSLCIYQGEELGLTESEVAFEDMQDPYGIAMWPEFKGRDGCRTPMAWDSTAADLGFGSGTTRPWLPVDQSHRALAVDRQEADAGSLLQHYRRLLQWRKTRPALVHGEIELLPQHRQVLAYVRQHVGERVLCAFNLSDRDATFALRADDAVTLQFDACGVSGASARGTGVDFEPFGVLFARVA